MPEYLRFCRLRSVGVPFSRTKVSAMVDAGEFPAPVPYGEQRAWIKSEVERWVAKNLAARG